MAYRKTITVRPTKYEIASSLGGATITNPEFAIDGQESTCAKANTVPGEWTFTKKKVRKIFSSVDLRLGKDNWLSDLPKSLPKSAKIVSCKIVVRYKGTGSKSYEDENVHTSYSNICVMEAPSGATESNFALFGLPNTPSEEPYSTFTYTLNESKFWWIERFAETAYFKILCMSSGESYIDNYTASYDAVSLDLYDIYLELTYEAETSGKAKVNGEWKDCALKCKVNGEWKDVTNGKVKVGGEWIEIS